MAATKPTNNALGRVFNLLRRAGHAGDEAAVLLIRQAHVVLLEHRLCWSDVVADGKMQKLLQLSSSPNENEALLAFRTACRMMADNGLVWQWPTNRTPTWVRASRSSTSTMVAILRMFPLNITDESWVRANLFRASADHPDPARRLHWTMVIPLLVALTNHFTVGSSAYQAASRWLDDARQDGWLTDRQLIELSWLCRNGCRQCRANAKQ